MILAAVDDPRSRPQRRLAVTSSAWAKDTSHGVKVSVSGEVDAANAKDFAVAVCEAAAGAPRVTLDLSRLEFMAFDGVAALHAVNAHLTRADVPWWVVPGAAVSRVLDLCDPECLIPVADPDRGVRRRPAALRLVEPA